MGGKLTIREISVVLDHLDRTYLFSAKVLFLSETVIDSLKGPGGGGRATKEPRIAELSPIFRVGPLFRLIGACVMPLNGWAVERRTKRREQDTDLNARMSTKLESRLGMGNRLRETVQNCAQIKEAEANRTGRKY